MTSVPAPPAQLDYVAPPTPKPPAGHKPGEHFTGPDGTEMYYDNFGRLHRISPHGADQQPNESGFGHAVRTWLQSNTQRGSANDEQFDPSTGSWKPNEWGALTGPVDAINRTPKDMAAQWKAAGEPDGTAPPPAATVGQLNFGTPNTGPKSTAAQPDYSNLHGTDYIFARESQTGDPATSGQNARNPHSSAAGSGQFLHGTWNDGDLKARAGYGAMPADQWEALRMANTPEGVEANRKMTQANVERDSGTFTARNKRPPSEGEVYGMHVLGADGFQALMKADPQTPAANVAPKGAVVANHDLYYNKDGTPKTVQQLLNQLTTGAPSGGARDPWTYPNMVAPDYSKAAATLAGVGMPSFTPFPNMPAPQVDVASVGKRPAPQLLSYDDLVKPFQAAEYKPLEEGKYKAAAKREAIANALMALATANGAHPGAALLAAVAAYKKGTAGGDKAFLDLQRQQDQLAHGDKWNEAQLNANVAGANNVTTNQFGDKGYEDSWRVATANYTNAAAAYSAATQRWTANHDNEKDLYAARTALATATANLQALSAQGQAGATNQTNAGQAQVNLAGVTTEQGPTFGGFSARTQGRTNDQILAESGIDPRIPASDAAGQAQRDTAAGLAGGNADAVVKGVVSDAWASGQIGSIVSPATFQAYYQAAIPRDAKGQPLAEGKYDKRAAMMAASAAMASDLARNPAMALQFLQEAGKAGNPSAKMALRYLQNGQQPPAAP